MDIKSSHKFTSIDYIKLVYGAAPKTTIAEWIFTAVFSFLPALQAIATKIFIDHASDICNNKSNIDSILLPLVFLLTIICIGQANSVVVYTVEQKQKKELSWLMKTMMIRKHSKLKYYYIEDDETWDLIVRVSHNTADEIYGYYSNMILFIQNIIQIVSLMTVMLAYVRWPAVIILLMCLPGIYVAYKAGTVDYRAFEESDKIERRADYLHKVLIGRDHAAERTLFRYKDFLQERWASLSEKSRKVYQQAVMHNLTRTKAAGFLITAVFLTVLCIFTHNILNNSISAGVMISVAGASKTFVDLFTWNLSENAMCFSRSNYFLRDLTEFWGLEETDTEPADEQESPQFEQLRFENVSFKYPGTDRYVLKDISLELDKDRHYAIVGANGSGKTTMLKLITGLYDDYEGKILLNGRDIRTYSHERLNEIFSVAFQDFAKYSISFRENLVLDDKTYNKELYSDIKEKLGLDKVVDSLSKKDETLLGKAQKNGVELSGGEWQRTAIARSLYKRSPFRILDEPTASLDPSAESKVYSMFRNICCSDTTLVITHRLGAAKFSDEIIVIDDGRVVEKGDHDTLLNLRGIYCKMFLTQRGNYE